MTTPSPTQPERDALEAAARALYEHLDSSWPELGWANESEDNREYFRGKAQAVVAAYLTTLSERGMRVMPRQANSKMDLAASDYYSRRRRGWSFYGVWAAMWDAADGGSK